jgi:alanine racemase
MNKKGLKTWIEIDTSSLTNNYKIFRRLIGKKCKLMAVAKSNAYGHSLTDFARNMQKTGVDWIAVDSVIEANALRNSRISKPILVLGHTVKVRYKEAAEKNISVTISTFEGLNDIERLKFTKKLKIHIKVDTGMHRQGFYVEQLPSVCEILSKLDESIIFEGIYTHFAAAKNPAFPHPTHEQIRKYLEAIEVIEGFGFSPLKHAAATSGTIVFPGSHFDMVRIGIGLYGLWPSLEVKHAYGDRILLKPALSWKAVISEIKRMPAGSRVGYNFTELLEEDTLAAIVPVGYWHGYPRQLSSIGRLLVGDSKAKILGLISMDMIVIDITGIKNVHVGDEITMIGHGMHIDELANLAETINYEVVTRINPLVKRFYI